MLFKHLSHRDAYCNPPNTAFLLTMRYTDFFSVPCSGDPLFPILFAFAQRRAKPQRVAHGLSPCSLKPRTKAPHPIENPCIFHNGLNVSDQRRSNPQAKITGFQLLTAVHSHSFFYPQKLVAHQSQLFHVRPVANLIRQRKAHLSRWA